MRFALCALVVLAADCAPKTDVELYVDGFLPKNVRFEIVDQGPMDKDAVNALAKRPDVDGALLLPAGTCAGPCRVSLVSVFVKNDREKDAEPPPVIRLKTPAGKPERLPIAFRGKEIDKGRVGRIRWVVEMYPEEKALTATLSSSVRLVDSPPPPPPPPPSAPPSAPAPGSPGTPRAP